MIAEIIMRKKTVGMIMEAMLLKLVESCVSIQNYRNDNGNNNTEAG